MGIRCPNFSPPGQLAPGLHQPKKVNWSSMSSWLNTWTVYQVGLCFDQIILYNCTAHQCSLLRRNFIVCSIINPALLLLMKHLVIGQLQKSPNFLAFHWSPHGSLVFIGQYFVSTRVVHFTKRAKTSLITELDRSGLYHRIGPGCAGRA